MVLISKGAHTTVCDLHTSASLVARSETLQGTDFEERATIFSKKISAAGENFRVFFGPQEHDF